MNLKFYLLVLATCLFTFCVAANNDLPHRHTDKDGNSNAEIIPSFINWPNTGEELGNKNEIFRYDPINKKWTPQAIQIPLKDEIENQNKFTFDPVRFTIRSNKDSVALNEPIELTITAEYLNIHPSLMFQFEGSNEFALKMLLPEGFVQTGGTYYDFITGKVTKENPFQTFTIQGYFEKEAEEPCFTLLRSHNRAGNGDSFVRRAWICINYKFDLESKPSREAKLNNINCGEERQSSTNSNWKLRNWKSTTCGTIKLYSGTILNSTVDNKNVRVILHVTGGACNNPCNNNAFDGSCNPLVFNGTFTNSLDVIVSFQTSVNISNAHFDIIETGQTNICDLSVPTPCELTDEVIPININPNPSEVGGNVTISASKSLPGFGFHWIGPNGFTSTSEVITLNNVNLSQAGLYSLAATDDCIDITGSNTLIVNNPCPTNISVPTISASSLKIYNQPNVAKPSLTYSRNCDSGYTRVWYKDGNKYNDGNTFLGNLESINEPGTYTAKCENGSCSATSNSKIITSESCNVTTPSVSSSSYTLNTGQSSINIYINSNYADSEIKWLKNGSDFGTGKNKDCEAGTNGATVTYQVYAQLANGCTSASTYFTVSGCAPPPAPYVTADNNNQVLAGQTGVNIYANGCSFNELSWSQDGGSTWFQGLEATGTYFSVLQGYPAGVYKVKCIKNFCESSVSTITVTQQPCTGLQAPSISADWNGVIQQGQSTLNIYVNTACNNGAVLVWSKDGGPDFTSDAPLALNSQNEGKYRVRCKLGNCYSAYSNEITVTKAGCNPIPSITNITSERGLVIRKDLTTTLYASGCSGYQVKWSKDGGSLVSSNSYNNGLATLDSQTKGRFKAKCVDNFGCEGAFSPEIEVKEFGCSDLVFNTNVTQISTNFLEGTTAIIEGRISSVPSISPAYVLQTDFRFIWEKVTPVVDYGDGWWLTIPNATLANAGQYRLKAKMLDPATHALLNPEFNCYSNPITVTITPKLDCDNQYIKATNSQNIETTKLTRANGSYENLTLKPANFDGSPINANLSYVWTGPAGAITTANRNSPQISTNIIGEYTVNISNGFQQCSQKISISGTPCNDIPAPNFCLGGTLAPPSGAGGAALPNLAVGDIITAGNFEFTVTQVGSATQPFSGKATMNIINGPGHLKAGLKTEFAGISINECYQVTAVPAQNLTTYFKSEYDPSWGNIFDASTQTPKPAEPGEEINALIAVNEKVATEMEAFTNGCAQRERLVQYLAELNAIMAQIQVSADYTATEKTDIANRQNAVTSVLNSLVGLGGCLDPCVPNGRVAAPAGVNCATGIDVMTTNVYLKGLENLNIKTWATDLSDYVPDSYQWEQLTPEIFRDLSLDAGVPNTSPVFETRLGRIFEDVVLRSMGRSGNNTPFPTNNPLLTPKSVIPDAVAQSGIVVEEMINNQKETVYYWWQNSVFLDAKFTLKKEKMIYFKGNNIKNEDQIEGFLDVLKNQNNAKTTTLFLGSLFGIGSPINKNASRSEAAYLVIITPVGVTLEDKILQQAGIRNIAVLQSTCEYWKSGNNVYLKVNISSLKNQKYLGGKYKIIGTYGGKAVLIDFTKI